MYVRNVYYRKRRSELYVNLFQECVKEGAIKTTQARMSLHVKQTKNHIFEVFLNKKREKYSNLCYVTFYFAYSLSYIKLKGKLRVCSLDNPFGQPGILVTKFTISHCIHGLYEFTDAQACLQLQARCQQFMWRQKFALTRNTKLEPENPKDNQVYPIIVRGIHFA